MVNANAVVVNVTKTTLAQNVLVPKALVLKMEKEIFAVEMESAMDAKIKEVNANVKKDGLVKIVLVQTKLKLAQIN